MYKKFLIMVCCLAAEFALASEPLVVFDSINYEGEPVELVSHDIYSGKEIPGGLNRKISSLILKKGYQVCISTQRDGTGPSKVLIAAKRDIRIPKLSRKFHNRIQFIRVLPWRNADKKGYCGKGFKGMNASWFYVWGPLRETTPELQWTPMSFGRSHANAKRIDLLIEQEGIQDLLCFNEIDHKGHQGAKDGFLFVQRNAVAAMGDLAKTGLRLGGPSLREGGPRKWLPKFCDLALENEVRMDFLGVHWYDWGSNPRQTPDADAELIFKRFKSYINRIHNQYSLPIWITEFNCNPARDKTTQIEFLKLALPHLDSLPYVERYAYFQPFGGNGDFREERNNTDTPLTEIGELWRDHVSVPAMDKEVYLGGNNLFQDEVEEEKR